MHLRTKFALLLVAILAFLPAAGNAFACDGGHAGKGSNDGKSNTSFTADRYATVAGPLAAAASYLGLTQGDLKAKLASGQSLADIAKATPGKSATGLVAALLDPVKTKLGALVAAGKVTAGQETAIVNAVTAKIAGFINATWANEYAVHAGWQHKV